MSRGCIHHIGNHSNTADRFIDTIFQLALPGMDWLDDVDEEKSGFIGYRNWGLTIYTPPSRYLEGRLQCMDSFGGERCL